PSSPCPVNENSHCRSRVLDTATGRGRLADSTPRLHTSEPPAMPLDRRTFLQSSLALPAITFQGAAAKPSQKHVLGILGVRGRGMVEAARAHKRVVQVGTQRRSGEYLAKAAEFVRAGKLGKVPFARAWIAGNRKTIGRAKDAPVPEKVDYNLWLGPAPERPFNPNRFHYNWHWFWDYSVGELGNNGIHGLDMIRLLLGDPEAPTRVSSGGGKLFYDDQQETPD